MNEYWEAYMPWLIGMFLISFVFEFFGVFTSKTTGIFFIGAGAGIALECHIRNKLIRDRRKTQTHNLTKVKGDLRK